MIHIPHSSSVLLSLLSDACQPLNSCFVNKLLMMRNVMTNAAKSRRNAAFLSLRPLVITEDADAMIVSE